MAKSDRIAFTKMEGLGNDFVVIDDLGSQVSAVAHALTPELVRRISDRRFGVGCDQLLWLRPAKRLDADARMEIFNSDGTIAEMCGNGVRAAALYLFDHGAALAGRGKYVIETLAGLIQVGVRDREMSVDMGAPVLGAGFKTQLGEPLQVLAQEVRFFAVNMGNPHVVIFGGEDLLTTWAPRLGPEIETNGRFPDRTNVEFVQVLGPDELRVRVWERGAGLTLACGTGACAAAVAALELKRVKGRVIGVHLPGGALHVTWEGSGNPVIMEGPAEEVFRGEYLL